MLQTRSWIEAKMVSNRRWICLYGLEALSILDVRKRKTVGDILKAKLVTEFTTYIFSSQTNDAIYNTNTHWRN